jgi:hypothetical protein
MNKEDLKKIEYQSWHHGNEWTDEEIDFIIEKNCSCDNCGNNVEEFDDFPEIDIQNNEFLCEDCYKGLYMKTCPMCEDYYDIKEGESEYRIVVDAKIKYNQFGFEMKDGIYHHDQLIVPMDVIKLKEIDCGKHPNLWNDDICPDCVAKIVRKDFYMKSVTSRPMVLHKNGFEFFKKFDENLTLEKYKKVRINLIHERINYKGMIQKHNHLKI